MDEFVVISQSRKNVPAPGTVTAPVTTAPNDEPTGKFAKLEALRDVPKRSFATARHDAKLAVGCFAVKLIDFDPAESVTRGAMKSLDVDPIFVAAPVLKS
jgi:hypothetical protein